MTQVGIAGFGTIGRVVARHIESSDLPLTLAAVSAGNRARAEAANARPEAKDAVGNVLNDGDSVVLIKDLAVKGAGQTLKVGTVIRSIRLTADPDEIDCRYEGIKGLVLRTEFVRKR